MKVVVIGSVSSTNVLLEEMVKHDIKIYRIFSLHEEKKNSVSGYFPLHEFAKNNNIDYTTFKKINDDHIVKIIQNIKPDYIFVTGLSQIICKEIIESARIGVIGNHPTDLPKFRGRAAIPWLILLGVKKSKVSLFFIDEGVDSGDIIDKEEYKISNSDYALDVINKVNKAFRMMLKRVLPKLEKFELNSAKQNHQAATYLLKRKPEDGLIKWDNSGSQIISLIRASSNPYPGAFSYYKGNNKIIIWRASFINNSKYIGISGQIAEISKDNVYIVCNDGLLKIEEYSIENNVRLILGEKLKEKNI